jgi:hypothetical protein
MNLDGEKLCMKIVDLDKIYKFIVQIFSISNHTRAQKINITLRSKNSNFRSKDSVDYWSRKMISNETYWNYKLVDLVKVYNLIIIILFEYVLSREVKFVWFIRYKHYFNYLITIWFQMKHIWPIKFCRPRQNLKFSNKAFLHSSSLK